MSKTELEASLKEMGIEVSELSYDNSICVITRSGKNEKAVEYIKKVSNLEIIGEIDRFCFEINNNIVSELVYLIDDADSFSDLCSRLGVDPDTNYKEEKESLGAKMDNKIYSGHVNLSRKYVLVIRYNADTGNGWGYITTNENAKINYPDSF